MKFAPLYLLDYEKVLITKPRIHVYNYVLFTARLDDEDNALKENPRKCCEN